MKRIVLVLLFLAAPLFAQTRPDCAALQSLGALYEVRAVMLQPHTSIYDVQRAIDQRIDQLREPLGNGRYRWLRYVRPSGNAPEEKKGHLTVAVQGSAEDADHFEAADDNVFAVRIVVPEKRSIFNRNNAVWVSTVTLTFDDRGRTMTRTEKINAWMNPDTSRTFDLGTVSEHAVVGLDCATHEHDRRESLVEIHFVHAVAEDDPDNPAYPAIRALRDVRNYPEPAAVDRTIAELEARLFPSVEPVPLLEIVTDLRKADELMNSKKPEEQEKGTKLLHETLRRLH